MLRKKNLFNVKNPEIKPKLICSRFNHWVIPNKELHENKDQPSIHPRGYKLKKKGIERIFFLVQAGGPDLPPKGIKYQ
ncbi:MAG: hypothetical protein CM15mP73_1680 [Hyphomicrobiales bacterium]|nr:MAG: hypothetical protein CM15mP73_1680 [Hyphomicrobiales bacterium]